MTVAILCPGPSLARLASPPDASLLIVVNRAATRFAAHVWAAMDVTLIEEWGGRVRGDPLLFTSRSTRASLMRRGNPWGYSGTRCADDMVCPVPRFGLFTSTAALVLAAHQGVKRIDVYGADWTDEPDFDGVETTSARRNGERWATERGIWDAVVEWIKPVVVTRK